MNSGCTCTQCHSAFSDHLQGRLAPADALALARHLHSCKPCREALALAQRLRALPAVAAPPGLAAAVLAQRDHRVPAAPSWLRATLAGAAAEVAFRTLADPLLLLDLQLRQTAASLLRLAEGTGTAVRGQFKAATRQLGQDLALPLRHAGRQVQAALADRTQTQPRR